MGLYNGNAASALSALLRTGSQCYQERDPETGTEADIRRDGKVERQADRFRGREEDRKTDPQKKREKIMCYRMNSI